MADVPYTAKMAPSEIAHLFSTRRFCYYIPADGYVEAHGFRVSIVFENEPGHHPTGDWPYDGRAGQKAPWFWGPTYDEACATAREMNARMGLDAKTAFLIVTSSMAVSREPRGRRRP